VTKATFVTLDISNPLEVNDLRQLPDFCNT